MGFFAVPKVTDTQRLILEATKSNILSIDPPKVDLSSSEHLVELYLPPEQTLYVRKVDMDNHYRRLQMFKWVSEFFGRPGIELKEDQK